jgi:hypothetical protein
VTLRVAVAASALIVCIAFAACSKLSNTPTAEALGNVVHELPGFEHTPGLEIHAVRSIKSVIVHKIAVMPMVDAPDAIDKTVPQGASEAITADVYARANMMGGWEVVPQEDVAAALQQMPPLTLANLDQTAIALGQKVAADGVIYGTVSRYRERVGFDYAAQSPASVAFTLYFLDEHTKQVVWTAKFAREQRALSENVLDLPNFLQNKGRWVRAHDIAAEGIQGALDHLQSHVTVMPVMQGK